MYLIFSHIYRLQKKPDLPCSLHDEFAILYPLPDYHWHGTESKPQNSSTLMTAAASVVPKPIDYYSKLERKESYWCDR